MALTDEQFVLLTTFRRDGRPVSTPVWIADMGDGRGAFWTSSDTGKIKRLRHTARVTVQACNARGRVKPGSEPVEGTAAIVTGAELEQVRRRVLAKYGLFARLSVPARKFFGRLRGRRVTDPDCGVVITF